VFLFQHASQVGMQPVQICTKIHWVCLEVVSVGSCYGLPCCSLGNFRMGGWQMS